MKTNGVLEVLVDSMSVDDVVKVIEGLIPLGIGPVKAQGIWDLGSLKEAPYQVSMTAIDSPYFELTYKDGHTKVFPAVDDDGLSMVGVVACHYVSDAILLSINGDMEAYDCIEDVIEAIGAYLENK